MSGYLLGKHSKIMTDHKPLTRMFNNPRAHVPFRIERLRRNLQVFCYCIDHIYGASNPYDYLPQHSVSATKEHLGQTKDFEAYVNYIFQHPVIEPVISLDEFGFKSKAIENCTIDNNDANLNVLINFSYFFT